MRNSIRRPLSRIAPLLGSIALLLPSLLSAQAPAEVPTNKYWAYTMDVQLADMAALEAGIAELNRMAAERGSNQTVRTYSAMTGSPSYLVMEPGLSWTAIDEMMQPDPDEMEANQYFMDEVAPLVQRASSEVWVLDEELSIPPPEGATYPVWQVIEWEAEASTQAYLAITNVFRKIKEAFTAAGAVEEGMAYSVFEIQYHDGPPTWFVAFPVESFASMEGGDPLAFFNLMVAQYGHQDAVQIDETLANYLTPVSATLWRTREDLSYTPEGGM